MKLRAWFNFSKSCDGFTYLGGKNRIFYFSTNSAPEAHVDDEEFRVLDLKRVSSAGVPRDTKKKKWQSPPLQSRADSMPTDQDWTNVWPAPRSFHPAVVPLPIRQGVNKLGPSPDKYGNAELMKIPNFLHLTPPAIEKHCSALKSFCTEWPKGLETEEQIKHHFPLEVISSDYCHSSSSIRDPLSRIITIKFPLSSLELDSHAKDKFLRLIGERYDEKTDIVTIVTDKCPLRKQNYDYALYLLTALYHESWNLEEWEKTKSEADYEMFVWDLSVSKANVQKFLDTAGIDSEKSKEAVSQYSAALTGIFDEGENDYTWNKYREASEKLLFLK